MQGDYLFLPGLELVYTFGYFSLMAASELKQVLKLVKEERNVIPENLPDHKPNKYKSDDLALSKFFIAIAHKCSCFGLKIMWSPRWHGASSLCFSFDIVALADLGNYTKALAHFSELNTLAKKIKLDHWIGPYGKYEEAGVHLKVRSRMS